MNDIEQQFFKVFGIEPFIYCSKPRLDCPARKVGTCTKECEYYSGLLYPEITAEKLLELICLVGNTEYFLIENTGNPINVETLKGSVLHTLTLYSKFHKELKHQVRSLFE